MQRALWVFCSKQIWLLENEKGISVVIPNYNGHILLGQILPPLYEALQQTALNYEIIISDDNSTDDSVAYIRTAFPQIKVLQSEANRGFSPTINKGIFAAKYTMLLLLNSDVKLMPDYFEKLLPYFDAEDTFGVMGRIIGWDDDTVQDGGKYPSFHGVKIKTGGNYVPLESKPGERLYSMYLSGANAFVSRAKIIMLGGFDELFAPFYVEDFELSLRAWRIGWKCYYEHHAICRHKISASIKSASSKNVVRKIYYRNKMFLHAIHLSKNKLSLWYLQLILETSLHFFTGRWWFFGSLKLFFLSHKEMLESKDKFERLSFNKKNLKTLNEVVNKITSSLGGISSKRFV